MIGCEEQGEDRAKLANNRQPRLVAVSRYDARPTGIVRDKSNQLQRFGSLQVAFVHVKVGLRKASRQVAELGCSVKSEEPETTPKLKPGPLIGSGFWAGNHGWLAALRKFLERAGQLPAVRTR
jgi:hypothetical protein